MSWVTLLNNTCWKKKKDAKLLFLLIIIPNLEEVQKDSYLLNRLWFFLLVSIPYDLMASVPYTKCDVSLFDLGLNIKT